MDSWKICYKEKVYNLDNAEEFKEFNSVVVGELPDYSLYEGKDPIKRVMGWSRIKAILDNIKKGQTILIAGCGYGYIAREIYRKKKPKKLVAFDLNEQAIKNAKKLTKKEGLDIDYRVGDARDIEIEDQYDVVACSEVLEHIPHYEIAVPRLCSWTKPGGKLIITIPDDNRVRKVKKLVIKSGLVKIRPVSKNVTMAHLNQIKPNELAKQIKKSGLTVKTSKRLGLLRTAFLIIALKKD